jgi:ATP-dependent Clp protease ATP-binding subunit ClpC
MFERYDEPARRLLFFARYEASLTGSLTIESEHLLLGLLRDPGPIGRRLLAGTETSLDQLRQEIANRITFREEKVPTSVEIPFSEPVKRILYYTAEEADRLGHSYIGAEHVLLALLRVPESTAGRILSGHGLRLQTAREAVATTPAEGARTTPEPVPEFRVVTDGIMSDIDRIQRLVERIRMTLPTPHESNDLLDMLQVELASLRSRFS